MRSHEPLDPDVRAMPVATRVSVVLLVAVGIVGSLFLFFRLRSTEAQQAQAGFELGALERSAGVKHELDAALNQLGALSWLYDSSREVEPEEFRTFSSRCLESSQAVRALFWIEETPADRIVRLRNGPEANLLPEYLALEPALLEPLADDDKLVVSPPLDLRGPAGGVRLLAASPVFDRGGSRRGTVAALLAPERLLAPVSDLSQILTELRDVAGPSEVTLAGDQAAETFSLVRSLDPGGRAWRLTCTARPGFLESHRTLEPWGALLLGLCAVAAVMVAFITALQRSQAKRLAERRTREVKEAYGTLAMEAEERLLAVAMTRSLERQVREIIDLSPSMIYIKDWYGRFLLANEATARAYGTTPRELCSSGAVDMNADVTRPDDTLREERELMKAGLSSIVQAMPFKNAAGERRILRTVKVPCVFGKEERALLCISTDITAQRHAEDILQSQNRILREIARGSDVQRVLGELVGAAEEIVPGLRCSVLLLDEEHGRLFQGAAPSLPAFYNQAIEGVLIGKDSGSCGAAAFHGERVIVTDVSTHPNWRAYRELATRAKVRACWSEPIHGADGRILGTFAMYYSEVRGPEPFEEKLIESLAYLAGIAIERAATRPGNPRPIRPSGSGDRTGSGRRVP